MDTMDLTGVIAPLLTPFDSSGDVDYYLFAKQLDHVINSGVAGVSPAGSTGEGAMLDDDELTRLVELSRRAAGATHPVVAGVIRNSTRAAIATAKRCADAGADALMVTPTSYNILVPDAEGNAEFYASVQEATGLPVIVYNVVPQNELRTEDAKAMLAAGSISGVKQSLGGPLALMSMIQALRPDGLVYAATDELLGTCFELGADGAISAVVGLLPRTSQTLWEAAAAGDHATIQRLQPVVWSVWMKVIGPQFPARMKAISRLRGRDYGIPRSPLRELDPNGFVELVPLLDQLPD